MMFQLEAEIVLLAKEGLKPVFRVALVGQKPNRPLLRFLA
jgi:hypothetical protein